MLPTMPHPKLFDQCSLGFLGAFENFGKAANIEI
jgi:hypothetical protein